jgi:MFS family permease
MLIMGVVAAPFAFAPFPGLGGGNMLIGIAGYTFCVLATTSTVPALLQVITPNRLRGQISAIYLTILNIATLALSPLVVALLTDYVFRDELALGRSLTVVACLTTPASLVFLWLSRRPLQAHLDGNKSLESAVQAN